MATREGGASLKGGEGRRRGRRRRSRRRDANDFPIAFERLSPPSRPLATVRASSGAWERLRILQENRRIAMVGLSADPMRPSHFAAIYMQSEGYDVIPVNPRYAGQTILGETVYSSLEEIPGPVDIVDVFRRAEELPKIARSAAAIGANVLWMQLGIVNDEAAQIAREAGLEVVMDRCVKIEHARFFGGLNLVGMNTGVVTSRRRIGVKRCALTPSPETDPHLLPLSQCGEGGAGAQVRRSRRAHETPEDDNGMTRSRMVAPMGMPRWGHQIAA